MASLATIEALLTQAYIDLANLSQYGHEYDQRGKRVVRADLLKHMQYIDWLEGQKAALTATAGSATNYAVRGRAV